MVRPNEVDADFKMMTQPDEWPQWPVLPLVKGDRSGVMVSISITEDTICFFPDVNMFDKVRMNNLSYVNSMVTPQEIRGLIDDGWRVSG